VGQDYYKRVEDEALAFGNSLSSLITHEGYMLVSKEDTLNAFVEEKERNTTLPLSRYFHQNFF